MELLKKEDNIIKIFSLFKRWEEKYEYIINLGRELPQISNEYKTSNQLIQGCQSRVWLHTEKKDNFLFFYADSDALIPKGIAALIIKIYSGSRPIDILQSKGRFISTIGFQEFLSPIRANGILLMLKKIKLYAITYYK